jgi:hypothetical protein
VETIKRNREIASALTNREVEHFEAKGPMRFRVLSGTAYVTRSGDWHDYILRSGEVLNIEESGRVVVQGFPAVEYKVCA